MANSYYRAINFDLYKKKLDKSFGNASKMYKQIKNFMVLQNFQHRQGSGYLSNDKLSTIEFWDIMDNMYEKHKWLRTYAKDIIVTNIIGEFDIKKRYLLKGKPSGSLKI